ncbi:SET and MYND domain-containing protein 4-like [Aphidius gifuensis]|uniref:SET and MYND domain-containing protein 4-like n=1 Tax=Aphidius gifuensis TaxID=684658 RepID=UPI001CDBB08B|nr:SET and MYND domain-containing protein 4-like [Aphidius gifuensis]
MDTSMLESEIKRRERVNNHAILWREWFKVFLTVVGAKGALPVPFNPKLNFFPTLTITSKDAHLSALYKKQGDVYFRKGEFMMAHKKYTQCITHAPAKSDLLAVAYGSRGIVLCFNNYMEDCLIDIERAKKHGYPNSLKAELFMWKAAAMQKLGKKKTLIDRVLDQASRWLRSDIDRAKIIKIRGTINSIKLSEIKKLKCYNLDLTNDALPPLKSRNPTVPGLSNSVGLMYSEKYGRHIVATQDIKAGDVIGIQKPYASVVKMNMRYNICWHCKEQTWTSIPCDTCSQVVFCSDECKKQAQDNYHDIECVVLCQTMAFDPLTKGFIEGKLDPTKFESVYGLCDLSSSSTANDQCVTYVDAIIMLYYLGKKIELFQEDRPIELLSFLISQQSFVLIVKRFLTLVQYNSCNYSLLTSKRSLTIASLIEPSFSFFNHSCCSNVIRTHRNGNLAIIAIRPIKEGEQVFANYGAYWFWQSREDRHKQLQRFHFTCDCEACEGDWSIPEVLKTPEIVKNKSFTHGGPYMNKELLGILHEYITVCTYALAYIKLNKGRYHVAKLVGDFAKFLNKEYKNYNNQSYEVFRVGKFIEELYMLLEKLFFCLSGKIDYPPLE